MKNDPILDMTNPVVKWVVMTGLVIGAIATASGALAAVQRQAAQNYQQARREEADEQVRREDEYKRQLAALQATMPKLTREMYDKLEIGMSGMFVDFHLSPVRGEEVTRTASSITEIYRDGPRHIIVVYRAGGLVSKLQSGL